MKCNFGKKYLNQNYAILKCKLQDYKVQLSFDLDKYQENKYNFICFVHQKFSLYSKFFEILIHIKHHFKVEVYYIFHVYIYIINSE